jgi:hypothetical protein
MCQCGLSSTERSFWLSGAKVRQVLRFINVLVPAFDNVAEILQPGWQFLCHEWCKDSGKSLFRILCRWQKQADFLSVFAFLKAHSWCYVTEKR